MSQHPSAHETDFTARVTALDAYPCLPGTGIEVIREPVGRGGYRHVLFDFDGTLSLIREGWPEVMVPMMIELLLQTPNPGLEEEMERTVRQFVGDLTGKQTIYQMMRFAEEVAAHGGTPEDPLVYKQMYLDRLMALIGDRREALRAGKAEPRDMLVPGSLELLEGLRAHGASLYLASGTDEPFVKEEAGLLGLTPLFGEHIYGARDDFRTFSKAMVIERILQENKVEGPALLGFGDGFVEIENVKAAGGAAVGVATDEAARSGQPDAWKRERLIGIGADLLIGDYREHAALLGYLFSE